MAQPRTNGQKSWASVMRAGQPNSVAGERLSLDILKREDTLGHQARMEDAAKVRAGIAQFNALVNRQRLALEEMRWRLAAEEHIVKQADALLDLKDKLDATNQAPFVRQALKQVNIHDPDFYAAIAEISEAYPMAFAREDIQKDVKLLTDSAKPIQDNYRQQEQVYGAAKLRRDFVTYDQFGQFQSINTRGLNIAALDAKKRDTQEALGTQTRFTTPLPGGGTAEIKPEPDLDLSGLVLGKEKEFEIRQYEDALGKQLRSYVYDWKPAPQGMGNTIANIRQMGNAAQEREIQTLVGKGVEQKTKSMLAEQTQDFRATKEKLSVVKEKLKANRKNLENIYNDPAVMKNGVIDEDLRQKRMADLRAEHDTLADSLDTLADMKSVPVPTPVVPPPAAAVTGKPAVPAVVAPKPFSMTNRVFGGEPETTVEAPLAEPSLVEPSMVVPELNEEDEVVPVVPKEVVPVKKKPVLSAADGY